MRPKIFTFMDWVAYRWGQYGCSSPSTKVLHAQGYDPVGPGGLIVLRKVAIIDIFLGVTQLIKKIGNTAAQFALYLICTNSFFSNFFLRTLNLANSWFANQQKK